MSIDRTTVKKVATLSGIAISDEEVELFLPKLNNILEWVEQLNEVNTDNVKPMTSVVDMNTPMRADDVTDGDIQEDILANAPETVEGFFVVPKIVE